MEDPTQKTQLEEDIDSLYDLEEEPDETAGDEEVEASES